MRLGLILALGPVVQRILSLFDFDLFDENMFGGVE
jgi:hypothetical protein